MLLGSGFLNFAQNLVTFTLIHKLTALSYAVANATKRITIISASLVTLKNPVTPLNIFGMFLAVLGVLGYNRVIKINSSFGYQFIIFLLKTFFIRLSKIEKLQ